MCWSLPKQGEWSCSMPWQSHLPLLRSEYRQLRRRRRSAQSWDCIGSVRSVSACRDPRSLRATRARRTSWRAFTSRVNYFSHLREASPQRCTAMPVVALRGLSLPKTKSGVSSSGSRPAAGSPTDFVKRKPDCIQRTAPNFVRFSLRHCDEHHTRVCARVPLEHARPMSRQASSQEGDHG